MKKVLKYTFVREDWDITNHGQIRKILENKLKLSRHEISQLKFRGEILLVGKKVYVNQVMQVGQILELHFPPDEVMLKITTDMIPEILYEEEDFVIINKPSGTNVHPSDGLYQMNSMGDALIRYYQQKGENFVIRTIGRLDKEASGIVLYAKNRPAAARLNHQRSNGNLKKGYIAIVSGHLENTSGHIAIPILEKKSQQNGEKSIIDTTGKEAHTFYRVMQEFKRQGKCFSVVWVMIETGRMHQIRAHFSAIGHPLLGDLLYGGDMSLLQRTALHCAKISLYSPFTKEKKVIEKDLPADLKSFITNTPIDETISASMTTMLQAVREETQDRVVENPAVLPIEKSEKDKTKKYIKLAIISVIFLLLLISFLVILYQFGSEKWSIMVKKQREQKIFNSLTLELENVDEVEYGSQIDAESLIIQKNGSLKIVGTIDTRKLGVQYLVYNLYGLDQNKNSVLRSYVKRLKVVDRNNPVIELKKESMTIYKGMLFTGNDNVQSVSDPVDGPLTLSEKLMPGTYVVLQSAVKNDVIGKYPVIIKGMDRNGNISTSGFTVIVDKSPIAFTDTKNIANDTFDTQGPDIEVKAEKIYLKKGDSYDLKDNIQFVSDSMDGILYYNTTLTKGHYIIEGTVDTKRIGITTITIKAKDQHDNITTKNFTVEVQEKTKIEFDENRQTAILTFLTDRMGLNRAAAIGILANMQRESKYNPSAGSEDSYYGLLQWNKQRVELLQQFANEKGLDYAGMEGQLSYLEHELNHTYSYVLTQLQEIPDSAEGAYSAGYLFAEQFEKGAIWSYSACAELAKSMY